VPRIKSAKKRMRQAASRHAKNKSQRSGLRTAVRKARHLTDPAAQVAAIGVAEKLLDRAGRKRLIHPNAAARQKSRLAKLKKAAA
jgi:small subunit ribosomal protein S20